MRIRRLGTAIIVGAGVLHTGCDLIEPSGVMDVTQISVRLLLEPDSVAPGDTAQAEAQVINAGTADATITTEADCFGELSLRRPESAEYADVYTEPGACWTIAAPLVLDPGDTAAFQWRIAAVRSSGQPLEPGPYQVYVEFDGSLSRGSAVPDVARVLTVR